MELPELERHLARINRSLKRAAVRTGDGYEYTAELPDGTVVRYKLNGVPPIEEVEDCVRHALIDLWSLRDYVIHALRDKGQETQPVWARVKARRHLALSADLANLAKHGELKRTHWSFRSSFGRSRYTATMRRDPETGLLVGSGIRQIGLGGGAVEMDFMNQDKPEWFSYELPVLDEGGDEVDEACNVMVRAHEEWSQLLDDLGIEWPAGPTAGVG